MVDLLHSNARTKGIDLYAFVTARCPVTVLGDAARLRQVLMNLVSFRCVCVSGDMRAHEVLGVACLFGVW